jgi:AmiR/NasT family two-component response regulator
VKVSFELIERLAARETSAATQKRFDSLMDAIRRRENAAANYAQLVSRIGEMEAALIDAKIASRANGLLENGARGGDVIGTLENHVEGVLRPSEFGTMLQQKLRELEEEIAERKLTAEAKAILQDRHGMSEEQAHLHLRAISRKSRKPLREVARDVIEEEGSLCLNRQ